MISVCFPYSILNHSFFFHYVFLYRFRWKCRRQQDVYTGTTIPFPDGLVAAALCKDGPITYHLKEESGISDDWIVEHVSPNITSVFGKNIGTVLGRALLWRIFDAEDYQVLPSQMVNDVKAKYSLRQTELDDGENPIAKVPLLVEGNNGQLLITTYLRPMYESDDEEETNDDGNGNENSGGIVGNNNSGEGGMTREQRRRKRRLNRYDETVTHRRVCARRSENQHLKNLTSHMLHMDRRLLQFQQNWKRENDIRREENRVVNKNIKQLQRQAFRVVGFRGKGSNGVCPNTNQISCPHCVNRQQQAAEEAAVIQQQQEEAARTPAKLCSSPKNLHVIWTEWEFGIGGNKPAKNFTPSERGRVKCVYSTRKVIWDKVEEMVRRGHSAHAAVNSIEKAYHYQSVTMIIRKYRKDKKDGNVPPELVSNPNAQ